MLPKHVVLVEDSVKLGRDVAGVGGRLEEDGDEVGHCLALEVLQPQATLVRERNSTSPKGLCSISWYKQDLHLVWIKVMSTP